MALPLSSLLLNKLMKNYLLILLFFSATINIFSQKQLPDFNNCQMIKPSVNLVEKPEFVLVLVSKAGCSYSMDALMELSELSNRKNLKIIIYEYGDLATIKYLYKDFFDFFLFIHANKCQFYPNNFSPTLYLYKDGNLKWKKEGWGSRSLKRLTKKIK
jgi:hypothetical protein